MRRIIRYWRPIVPGTLLDWNNAHKLTRGHEAPPEFVDFIDSKIGPNTPNFFPKDHDVVGYSTSQTPETHCAWVWWRPASVEDDGRSECRAIELTGRDLEDFQASNCDVYKFFEIEPRRVNRASLSTSIGSWPEYLGAAAMLFHEYRNDRKPASWYASLLPAGQKLPEKAIVEFNYDPKLRAGPRLERSRVQEKTLSDEAMQTIEQEVIEDLNKRKSVEEYKRKTTDEPRIGHAEPPVPTYPTPPPQANAPLKLDDSAIRELGEKMDSYAEALRGFAAELRQPRPQPLAPVIDLGALAARMPELEAKLGQVAARHRQSILSGYIFGTLIFLALVVGQIVHYKWPPADGGVTVDSSSVTNALKNLTGLANSLKDFSSVTNSFRGFNNDLEIANRWLGYLTKSSYELSKNLTDLDTAIHHSSEIFTNAGAANHAQFQNLDANLAAINEQLMLLTEQIKSTGAALSNLANSQLHPPAPGGGN